MSKPTPFLNASQAAERLGIRRDTLYAYVSRGLLRSEPSPNGRSRRYRHDDVEKLLRSREERRQPSKILEGVLHFGGPVLDSGLTSIEAGAYYYRGLDACVLSRTWSVEQVAEWLWLGNAPTAPAFAPSDAGGSAGTRLPRGVSPARPSSPPLFQEADGRLPPSLRNAVSALFDVMGSPWSVETLQAALPLLASQDPMALAARAPQDLAKIGARLLLRLVGTAADPRGEEEVDREGTQEDTQEDGPKAGPGAESLSIAERLARGWTRSKRAGVGGHFGEPVGEPGTDPEALATRRRLIETALILCADHELNVSSFTARCVASAESTLYSVVGAGLGALQGPRHGGHTRRVAALVREAGEPEALRETMADRLRRGEGLPGFGHSLYTDGDPRYVELRQRLRTWPASTQGPGSVMAWAEAFESAGRELLEEKPTIDVGLVLVGQALDLPRDSPIALFALGRTVGWIAHALEQCQEGRLIRPRARYVGPDPIPPHPIEPDP